MFQISALCDIRNTVKDPPIHHLLVGSWEDMLVPDAYCMDSCYGWLMVTPVSPDLLFSPVSFDPSVSPDPLTLLSSMTYPVSLDPSLLSPPLSPMTPLTPLFPLTSLP